MEKNTQKNSIFSIIVSIGIWGVLLVYLLALLKIIVFKTGFCTDFRTLSLLPFQFLLDFLNPTRSIDVLLKNTLGNFAIFIPMGILLPVLCKNVNLKKTVLYCFLVSLTIELSQYVFGIGMTDIDDLILNTLGAAVGALLYFNILKKIDYKVKTRIGTLTFLSVFGMCGVLSLWLYQPNILPAQIEVINQEILGELSEDDFNKSAVCTNIEGDILITYTIIYDEKTETEEKEDYQCIVDNNTQFFTKLLGAQYSPNGNVQKTICTYDQISKEEFVELIKDKKQSVELLISDDKKCSAVLVWMWESDN
ncbi:MAG: VanZ family protein [Anaerovorax sp.]|nr:VanZ family protein [Anaerovorax sp.]